MRHVYRKKNLGDLECAIHHSAIIEEGREEGEEKKEGKYGKNEARFCHHVLVASLGIPNRDILILNFRRGKETKNGGLRRRPHVEQEIRGGGIPRIGCQFVLEFSQWDYVYRLIVALQPCDALFISFNAATVHATTADPIHQLFLILVRAGFASVQVLKSTRWFV